MEVNILFSERSTPRLKAGDIVVEKDAHSEYYGLVIEGWKDGFNVLVLKTEFEEDMFLNHNRDIDQEELNIRYDLILPREDVIINIDKK